MSVSSQVQPHPHVLGLGDTLVMVLVDDQPQATDPIIHGSPTLGWAGDQRLCVYYWPKRQAYVLMRLEADGEYRIVCELPAHDKPLSPAAVNKVIRRLIAHDTHRGFDPHAAVMAHNEKVEADRQAAHDEWVDEEIAPKLAWAYKRGMGGHLGGRKWQYEVPEAPWRSEDAAQEADAGTEG